MTNIDDRFGQTFQVCAGMNSTDLKAVRDRLGFNRLFYRSDEPVYASSISALLAASDRTARLDRESSWSFLQDGFPGDGTCFANIVSVPIGHGLIRQKDKLSTEAYISLQASYHKSVADLLLESLRAFMTAAKTRSSAYLLDGSIESALLLSLLKETSDRLPPVYVIKPELAVHHDYYYDDVAAALATAKHLAVEPHVVTVSEADYLRSLPACVKACEAPFANMHMVWWHLAVERLRADGIQTVAAAVGATEAFAQSQLDHSLPLIGSIFAAANVDAHTAFLEEEVLAHLKRQTADPQKWYLRHIARNSLPDQVVLRDSEDPSAPKHLLSGGNFLTRPKLKKLAGELGLPEPSFKRDEDMIKWATLLLLREQMIGAL